jgi:uncharacterized protein (DUF1778 family)
MSSKKTAAKAKPEPKHRKTVRKSESLRIRVTSSDKDLLERASRRVGLGVSAFVLSASLEKARVMLSETQP